MRFLTTSSSSTTLLLLVVILATKTEYVSSSSSFRNKNNSSSNKALRRLPSSSSLSKLVVAFATARRPTPLQTSSLSFQPFIGIQRGIIMHSSNARNEGGFIGNDDNEQQQQQQQQLPASGSFFHEVPPPPKEDNIKNISNGATAGDGDATGIGASAIDGKFSESVTSSLINEFGIGDGELEMFQQIVRKTRLSTNGSGGGFAKTTSTSDYTSPSIIRTTRKDTSTGDRESFVGIGMPLNNVNNPEYDSNGYTLYADEVTGEKRRVFEALVEYPSVFKMKIVGSDGDDTIVNDQQEKLQQQQQQQQQQQDGKSDQTFDNKSNNKLLFAPSIVKVVAESCGVDVSAIQHTIRKNGKWISVTVHAPVQNADMLYSLYENVDKDPRVKFKF